MLNTPRRREPYVTVRMVRFFMLDRGQQDNEIDVGFTFEDEEVYEGMERAGAAYADIPPVGGALHPGRLPADTNGFLHAIAAYLLIPAIEREKRNALKWTAGGVQASLSADRIALWQDSIKFHKAEFERIIGLHKGKANKESCYGIHH